MEAISLELISKIQSGSSHQLVIILKLGDPIIVEGEVIIESGMCKFDSRL